MTPMTSDHFQQEVLQRLSVIETQTCRVLEDVDGIDKRVDVLEREQSKEDGANAVKRSVRAEWVAWGTLVVGAIFEYWRVKVGR